MRQHQNQMLYKMKLRLLPILFVMLMSSVALRAEYKGAYESAPGYVDIEALADIQSEDTLTQVNLKTPLLKLAAQILKNEEPELAQMVEDLELVSVYVLEMNEGNKDRLMKNHDAVSAYLDKEHWDSLVTVQSDEEHVGIYTLMSDDGAEIKGLVVNVMDGDEAVVINIVGKIDMEQIAALGSELNIPELTELKEHMENS